MSFGGLILTNQGRNKIAAAISNEKVLDFTHVQLGDGTYNGSYPSKKELTNMVMEIPVTRVARRDNEVTIDCDWNSSQAPAGFYFREIGIIGNGVLCYYDNAGAGDAEYIDPESDTVSKEKRIRLTVVVSDDLNVTVHTASNLYALAEEVETAVTDLDKNKISVADIIDNLLSAAEDKPLSAKQGKVLKNLIDSLTAHLNNLANSDDATLDQMKEVVDYIKSNRSLIEEITTSKVNVSDIIDDLVSTSSDKPLSAGQGKELKNLIDSLADRLNLLADCDDTTLDQLSEIVAYIKSNKTLIDSITTSKVSVADIIDDLTHADKNKPLSANQGKVLKELISSFFDEKGNLKGNAATASEAVCSRLGIVRRTGTDVNYSPGVNRFEIVEFTNEAPNSPGKNFYHILTTQSQDRNFQTQLALGMTVKDIKYRLMSAGKYLDWITLITSDNYKNYAAWGLSDLNMSRVYQGDYSDKTFKTLSDNAGLNSDCILKVIRSNISGEKADTEIPWLLGGYSAGIAFGCQDTRGALSMRYDTPKVRFAGGNMDSQWFFDIIGKSGKAYNLDDIEYKADKMGDSCVNIGDSSSGFGGDWNNVVYNGFYKGYNCDHSPVGDYGWVYGIVIAHDTNFVRQILYKYAGISNKIISSENARYERVKYNGTWGEWVNTTAHEFDELNNKKDICYFATKYGPANSNYACFARLTINGSYTNAPIEFTLTRRGADAPCRVSIAFENADSTDPNIRQLVYTGQNYGVYAVKVSAGVWDLYARKAETYDRIHVTDVNASKQLIDITYPDAFVAEKHTGDQVKTAILGYDVKYSESSGSVKDPTNGNNVRLNYGAAGLGTLGSDSWFCVWNNSGTEIRAISPNNLANTAINALSEATNTPTDNDYYVCQSAGGGTTTKSYHRRPMSALWNWIKKKLSTVATTGSYNDLKDKPGVATTQKDGLMSKETVDKLGYVGRNCRLIHEAQYASNFVDQIYFGDFGAIPPYVKITVSHTSYKSSCNSKVFYLQEGLSYDIDTTLKAVMVNSTTQETTFIVSITCSSDGCIEVSIPPHVSTPCKVIVEYEPLWLV